MGTGVHAFFKVNTIILVVKILPYFNIFGRKNSPCSLSRALICGSFAFKTQFWVRIWGRRDQGTNRFMISVLGMQWGQRLDGLLQNTQTECAYPSTVGQRQAEMEWGLLVMHSSPPVWPMVVQMKEWPLLVGLHFCASKGFAVTVPFFSFLFFFTFLQYKSNRIFIYFLLLQMKCDNTKPSQ